MPSGSSCPKCKVALEITGRLTHTAAAVGLWFVFGVVVVSAFAHSAVVGWVVLLLALTGAVWGEALLSRALLEVRKKKPERPAESQGAP